MLCWRTVQTVEWSWPSVEYTHCHVARCDNSDTLASMWSGPCTPVPPTCMWFDVEPAASAAGVVVAWCVIALAPEERSMLHCSEQAVASGCCRMECHGARRCSSQALIVSDYGQTSVQVDRVNSRWRMWWMAIAQCEVTAEVTLNRPLLIFTRIDYPCGQTLLSVSVDP